LYLSAISSVTQNKETLEQTHEPSIYAGAALRSPDSFHQKAYMKGLAASKGMCCLSLIADLKLIDCVDKIISDG
jgi:hypothetical protein